MMSKKRLIIILVGLAGAGLLVSGLFLYRSQRTFEYNGQQYKPGEAFLDAEGCNTCSFDKDGNLQCTLMACEPSRPLDDDNLPTEVPPVNISFMYEDGKYKYQATIQKPTPCHRIVPDVVIRERFPEDVDLNFKIESNDQMCAQMISPEEVSGEIPVSEGAVIQVFVNGRLQPGAGIN
jgi:hypothetical protein